MFETTIVGLLNSLFILTNDGTDCALSDYRACHFGYADCDPYGEDAEEWRSVS